MHFLSDHGAVIDLRSELITLTSDKALPPHATPGNHALNVIEEQVTVPPSSSVIISVATEKSLNLEGVIEGNQHLLLNRQICVARGISDLPNGKAKVVLTNLSDEYRHLNIGTTIAYIDECVAASIAFALFDTAKPASPRP